MSRKVSTNSKIKMVLENTLFPDGFAEIKAQDPEKYRELMLRLERAAKAINAIFLGDRP